MSDVTKTSWIQTYRNIRFNPWEIKPQDVCIEDIAHGLANTCRWGGHCKQFYSVAQHSVLVSRLVPKEYALTALLHDASEAYIGDMPKPIKDTLPDYKKLEERIMKALAEIFNFEWPLPQAVHDADMIMLRWEAFNLLDDKTIISSWAHYNPLPHTLLDIWSTELAEWVFLNTYKTLREQSDYALAN